jgi:hypothetical protein
MYKNYDKKYMKKVRKLFQLISKSERAYLKDLEKRVNDYSEDFPNAVYSDYVDHFGEPKEILILYYEHTDIDKLVKYITFRKYIMAILAVITICSISVSAMFYKSYLEGKDSYINREVIEIIEE